MAEYSYSYSYAYYDDNYYNPNASEYIQSNLVVEYRMAFDATTYNPPRTYKYTYRKRNSDGTFNNELEYPNDLDLNELSEISRGLAHYVLNKNVIILYMDDLSNEHLYQKINGQTYSTLNQLNSDLKVNTIDFNKVNDKIKLYIQKSVRNFKQKIIKIIRDPQYNNKFYIHLKFNKFTYYPYINDIKKCIITEIQKILSNDPNLNPFSDYQENLIINDGITRDKIIK